MFIYDTNLKQKIEFKPLKKGEVSMYVCGPTVYDVPHLGHGRSAVCFDVIRRYFEYKGLKVNFVSNYTDIDDKMINRANQEKISVSDLAKKIIPEYELDYGMLGVKKPNHSPRATEYIDEMVALIKKLEEGGYTYLLEDGVYFDISKYKEYGSLSGQNLEDLKAGARVDINKDKHTPFDFVLWKFKKEGEPAWKSPWGDGRPGWHIECSAMSEKLLGESFDIHGGGLDLQFPHHECEVAQSACALGKGKFAQHWMHNGFITIDNEKMSKSLGNFFTLKEIFAKYDPQVVRLMFLQTHYRNPINFSNILLDQAKAALEKLHNCVRLLKNAADNSLGKQKLLSLKIYEDDFEKAMDNDFDGSGALAAVFALLNELNSMQDISVQNAKEALDLFKKFDAVLGVIFPREEIKLDDDVEAQIKEREEARKNKDFKKSDKIRDDLLEKGIVLEDTPNGTIWKKA